MNLVKKYNHFTKVLTLFISFCFIFMSFPASAEVNSKIELTVGQTYSNFQLTKREYMTNYKSYINEFTHKKTGAKLFYIENKDEQKMFSIAFRTPCSDDTGVNHILEHSVLCGSEKFPVKNPFAKLLNKSLKSDMNAFTYPDKTMYPVSSKYDKDFKNLMSIYLDAVFFPNIYKNKNIFNQEGWRMELSSKEDELKLNGVVYSEMKGAYSDPNAILQDAVMKSLFPDTTYKYKSGGNPSAIPNLTYDKFIEVHKKYYHPSNSYIYLYGNIDILNTLKFIDDNYLNKFDKKTIDSKITLQKPFDKQNFLVDKYSVSKDTDLENKTYLSLNYVVGNIKDTSILTNLSLIDYLLMDSPKAPLKNALKDAGFNEANISVSQFPLLQPIFTITLKNANENDEDKFKKVVYDTLNKVTKEGFDKEDVKYVINKSLKSNKLDKAFDNFLSLNGSIISNIINQVCIYDIDPISFLDSKAILNDINNKISNGERYFENFLSTYVLNNNHSSFVMLKPQAGLEESINEQTKKHLADYKANLSEDELNKLLEDSKKFKEWQNAPDSEEALNSLPKLSLEDLKKPVVNYPTVEKNINGIKVLNHPINTSGASYIHFYFNTKNVPQDKLIYINLLDSFYGIIEPVLDTKNYTIEQFKKECSDNEITISSINSVLAKSDNNSEYTPVFSTNLLCPSDSIPKGFSMLEELLFNIKFEDKKKIHEEIKSAITNHDEMLKQGGFIASLKLLSYFSPVAKYNDELDTKYIAFLRDLDENFDEKIDSVIEELNEVKNLIFNKENLIASFTSDEENFSAFQSSFDKFANKLGNKKFTACEYKFDFSNKNEAYITNEKIQTVVKGYNFNKLGYVYNGSLDIVQAILNEYLFNTVRIKNGAYGANISIGTNGDVILSSFRDPNLKETLSAFDSTGNYLQSLKISKEELEPYIISALGKYDGEVPPVFIGAMADNFYLSGTNPNKIQQIREELINTKPEDINKYGKMLNDVLNQNCYCVAGNREKIEENKKLFTKLVDMSKNTDNNEGLIRLDGSNRYETASKIAKKGWKTSDYAIVAFGEDYADALTSAPLSKKYDAPILLTNTDKLDSFTKQTLIDLKVKNILIVGGNSVISENVEKELKEMGLTTERLCGIDRFETSVKVAEKLGNTENIIIADGYDFEPSLSIASVAANKNMPILLTDKQTISETVKNYTDKLTIKSVYAVGNSLSEDVTSYFKNVEKLNGKDIFEENINIVNKFEKDLNTQSIFLATGKDFADGLCGVALAAKYKAPLILVDTNPNTATKQYLSSKAKDLKNIYILGGEDTVSNDLFVKHLMP